MKAAQKKSVEIISVKELLAHLRASDPDALALTTHWAFASSEREAKPYREGCKQRLPSDVYNFVESQMKNCPEDLKRAFGAKFSPRENATFTFIDLFAGIGGFRIAMQDNGGRCVFSSAWNPVAQATYAHNFGETPFGDITLDSTKNLIPEDFDVLCAGFPCQALSADLTV